MYRIMSVEEEEERKKQKRKNERNTLVLGLVFIFFESGKVSYINKE